MRKTLSALNAPEGDPSEPPRQPAPHGMRRGSMVRVVSESAALFDALAITATSLAAEYFYNGWVLAGHPDAERALGAGAIAAIATILIYGRMLLYRSDSVLRPRVACLRKMITGWAFVVVGLIVATFLTKTSADYSRGWAMTWAVATPAVIVLGRFSLSFGARKIIGWGHLARHVAIVGQGPVADRIAAHLKKRSPEIVLIGLYDDRLTARSDGDLAPMGTLDDLVAKGQRAQLDEIIVTVPMNARDRLKSIVNRLAILPVDIRIAPGLPIIHGAEPEMSALDDLVLISALKRPISEWQWMVKSVFDRGLSFLLLLLFAPVLLLIGMAVRLDSKGPALFRQRRHGFNHEIITVLKFRTMSVMEDGATVTQAGKRDTRITRLGAILRRTSLDELPQLLNVLRGDMSLVGPRPHALAHNAHYSELIERYANRHRVKPGITGLAQVRGFRGETETPEKMKARIRCDLEYIDSWSLWLDIKILVQTVFVVFFQKAAY